MDGYVSSKNNVSLNNECGLITELIVEGENGTETTEKEIHSVFCGVIAIGYDEFLKASQAGLQPSCCLVVRVEEYSEEKLVQFDGLEYDVYRAYPRTDGLIELYCKRRLHND